MSAWPYNNPVDLAVGLALVAAPLVGLKRGLAGELGRLVSAVMMVAASLLYFRPFGAWLELHTRLTDRSAPALALVTLAVVTGGTLLGVRLLLGRVMKIVVTNPRADRIGGAAAGLLHALLLVCLIFLAMNLWKHEYLNRKFGEDSLVGTALLKCAPAAGGPETRASPPAAAGGPAR